VSDVQLAIADLSMVLRGLDLLDDWPLLKAGPCALTLLPRATALAAIWAQPAQSQP
jgi:hypothetical protein